MRFSTLAQWLEWQEGLHPNSIDLGLARVSKVWSRLQDKESPQNKIITVAGTNGKGSCIQMLDSIYRHASYKVARYTSPHLIRYNERIVLNGQCISDKELMLHFHAVDEARGDISLTYFEFGTLAAMHYFIHAEPHIILLEVGLGGRLDAVNIFDPDLVIITNISRDHEEWLGSDIEQIGKEKAGVMRANIPVIYADELMPQSIATAAELTKAQLYRLGKDYSFDIEQGAWHWQYQDLSLHLPLPGLPGEFQVKNAAAVMMAIHQLDLPVPTSCYSKALPKIQFPGRMQRLPGLILDVAHNAASAQALADYLKQNNLVCYAILGVLADKDLVALIEPLRTHVKGWMVTALRTSRAQSTGKIRETLLQMHCPYLGEAKDPSTAIKTLRRKIGENALILVYGSFYTVGDVCKNADKLIA